MTTQGFAERSTTLHLRAAEVSLLLDLSGGQLPAVLHWGADLGPLTADDAAQIADASVLPVPPNACDVPVRLALLPELHTGWLGRPGLSGHRSGAGWSPRFTLESAQLTPTGTAATSTATREISGHVEAGAAALVVRARDEQAALSLEVHIELLPQGLVRGRAQVRNEAGAATDQDAVYTVDDLVVAWPVPATAREILDFAGRWGKEKTPQRSRLEVGTHVRENRRGRTGADAAGIVHLGEPGFDFAQGRVWGVHTAYSGNHLHYAERLNTGAQVVGGGELLLPGEVRLEPGQSYAGPWVYGSFGLGLDQVARRFHRYLRARERHVDTARPVTLNVWEAVYFDHDLARLSDLARRAADLGVERFVLDDGWFGARRNDHAGLGDWVVSADAWPDGLGPLIDQVTGLGMQFGLWFEPEMVNPDSDVARAHPEWIMTARTDGADGWPVESRFQQVLNIGIPGAYEHVRDQMDALLSEYDIGYLKWDHNRDLIEAGDATRGGRSGVHAQTQAYYRLVDELKERHPGLEIESCSSGGARVDLEAMEHCDRIWVSDCIDPLERQQMNRWTMQLLPPELLGSHIASGRSHTTGRVHDLSFRGGTALLGHLGIEWDLAQASAAELTELRAWISYYKKHRDHLLSGDLVRVDVADTDTLNLYGVVSGDRARATYFYAVTARADTSPRPRMRLPGLDPARRYTVAPVIVGEHPSGLQPVHWWHGPGELEEPGALDPAHPYPDATLRGRRLSGGTFSGRVLAELGVQAPLLDPDQIVMFHVTAT
ncbi:alpha-galactosidase [Kineosphaera limosa]|nr:alpha-galactosidase [Kineosphaera limosa]NYD98857.1 alpha-galactosidase [Kineosphaera limosa]